MDVQTGNRRAIIVAMAELLKGRTLDQLTVADICEQAGISRQTFYRAFEDKYAAAFWYTGTILDATCRLIGSSYGWRDGYLMFFRIAEHNAALMSHLSASDDYNSVYNKTIRSSEDDLKRTYEQRYGSAPDELIAFQMHSFAHTATIAITEWLDGGCSIASDAFIDRFISLIPRELFTALDMTSKASGDKPFMLLPL